MRKLRTPSVDTTVDADLQALADEIATNTGVSPATALELARRQQPALRQFAGQWNAAVRRARAALRLPETSDDTTTAE